ncbi:TetR/AcrR family transcriptional regulator [Promicromonospora sp. NPDC057488]|uniref:TetR/AcrR family transcriptional regulator n=1 Tax=Promicromonospora sp. NPDC057488 TaxID=3346147 RepID=UPI00366E5FAB
MVRPRKFDRDTALQRAMRVFWQKGYAASSTDDLLESMGIGRQSLYNAFGDKRTLYLESLRTYQEATLEGHLSRLTEPSSALEGIRALLSGIAVADDAERALGCFGVGAVEEFGATDDEVRALAAEVDRRLAARIADRVEAGKAAGELDRSMDTADAVGFVQLTMTGLQVAARGGSDVVSMHHAADFAVSRLRAPADPSAGVVSNLSAAARRA